MGNRHSLTNLRSSFLTVDGELTEDILSVIQEDVPTVSAGSGAIAGIGVGPDGEPGIDNSPGAKRRRMKKQMPLSRISDPLEEEEEVDEAEEESS